MNEWLIEGNIIIRVGSAVFVILFFVNGIVWLSSKKMGNIPLGDFILFGIIFLFIFFNQQRVMSFAKLIPDTLGIAVCEVNKKVNDIGKDINKVRKVVKDVTSKVNYLNSKEMLDDIDSRTTFTLPKAR